MAQNVSLKALGLNVSPNPLELPDGALVEAKNVIIKRQDVIEPRRGFKLEGNPLPLTTDRLKTIFEYKSRLIRHYSNVLQFDNTGNNTFVNFSGNYTEQKDKIRIKTIDANGNLYFTTSSGVKKISAKTANNLSTDSGFIINAGGVKALDITPSLSITLGNQTGFLPQDSTVAYRVVWGYTDANDNLILGTPSQKADIYNPLKNLIIQDLNRTLGALDNLTSGTSLIQDGNYVDTLALDPSQSSSDIKAALTLLFNKLDTDIQYTEGAIDVATSTKDSATGGTIVFSSAIDTYIQAGDKIICSGFLNTEFNNNVLTVITVVNDTITVTPTTNFTGVFPVSQVETAAALVNSYNYRNIAETNPNDLIATLNALVIDEPTPNDQQIVLQDNLNRAIRRLQIELSGVISTALSNEYIQPLEITTTANVKLSITVPQDITNTNYFYQIYRSDISQATGTTILSNLVPNDEMKLVIEDFINQPQLTTREVVITDVTPDGFRGTNLYTNAFSGQGIAQANDLPPFALDINRFKNSVFYANTRTRHKKTLNLLGVSNLISDYNNSIIPKLNISTEDDSVTYSFVTGLPEISDLTFIADVADSYNGRYFTLNSANNETQYLFYYKTSGGTDTPPSTTGTITSITTGSTPVITSTAHGLYTGDKITLVNTNCVPSIDNTYFVTRIDANTFSVDVQVDTAGSSGTWNREATVQKINIITNETANDIATKTINVINIFQFDFFAVENTLPTISITNYNDGVANNIGIDNMPVGVATTVTQQGRGEDVSTKQILLSLLTSPAQAVDATARSLVRIINKDPDSPVNAYYISGINSIPGQILLEARELNENPFYIISNNSNTGRSFNPNVSPLITPTISSINAATDVLTTTAPHGLQVGDQIVLINSQTTPDIDGVQTVSEVPSSTTFKINLDITVGSVTTTSYQLATNAEQSNNESIKNRIYYSKLDQPEAVPLVNYFDVGASDKEIIRILPLRDSLFVFKEDGLYRISGELIPFTLSLFDSSCVLLASDSLGVINNQIYCWTTQGIATVSEAGVSFAVSRPIDIDILKLQSTQYTNFKTATFGVGYPSDNSYIVWCPLETTDINGTIAYRYSNLTNSWTIFDKDNTCAFLNPVDDKLYLGAGDTNYMEQERKNFNRYDYADREIIKSLEENKFFGNLIQFSDVSDVDEGDVLVQDQTVTAYDYNTLLQKLDIDPTVARFNITNIPIATSTVTITNSGTNGLAAGDIVRLTNTNCTPSIDGDYEVIGTPTATTFEIAIEQPITTSGSSGNGRFLYFDTLNIPGGGLNLRTKLEELTNQLDNDPGVADSNYSSITAAISGQPITSSATGTVTIITSPSHGLITGRKIVIQGVTGASPSINGDWFVTVIDSNTFSIPVATTLPGTGGLFNTLEQTFDDIKVCFNAVINKLNLDSGVTYNNYMTVDNNCIQEMIITDVNKITKIVTVNNDLPLFINDLTLFKAIESTTQYSPTTMGDPLNYKHMREATIMFENKAFTSGILSFSTDLLPQFTDIEFNADGNGIFGYNKFGYGFFGGIGNSAPFRTYIPRNAQRCRYLNVKFTHKVARESYSITGVTLTGETQQSSRAYRK